MKIAKYGIKAEREFILLSAEHDCLINFIGKKKSFNDAKKNCRIFRQKKRPYSLGQNLNIVR